MKNKRYWLRGGLIAFAIVLVFSAIFWFILLQEAEAGTTGIAALILGFPISVPILFIIDFVYSLNIVDGTYANTFVANVIISLLYLIIGVMCGWAYGKSKTDRGASN